jgi:hypothetical protein
VELEKVCLNCDMAMSRVVYGYPSESLLKIKEEKGWILGGCTPSDIEFLCKTCDGFWSSLSGFNQSDV